MKRIAVIGAGFLGSALAAGAARRDWDVTVIGRRDPYSLRDRPPPAGAIRFVPGDGVDLLPTVVRPGLDALVIAAGGRFPVPSSAEPVEDALGTVPLLITACETVRRSSPQTRIVFLSSAGAVYAPGPTPKRESEPAAPTSPYGVSRLAGEQYLSFYRRAHGLLTYSLRCANVYGRLLPEARGQGIVPAVFRSALTGSRFTLRGDGRQRRDLIHVDDFVQAALDLLECGREVPDVVNVGSGTGSAIRDVVSEVAAAMRTMIPIDSEPATLLDVDDLVTDISLLRGLIDFAPRSLGDGIELMAHDVLIHQPRRVRVP